MKILLAGPGTGKTFKIEQIVKEKENGSTVLILSFTNATVNDLQKKLSSVGITDRNCMTLHKFATKYNHDRGRHVLNELEIKELNQIVESTEIDFENLCDFLSCTTFDQMVKRFVSFAQTNPNYLKEKLSEYKTLIVDEYQDFNPYEQSLIDLIIKIIPDVYILGDDDQCIYDFKDASSDKLISFHVDTANETIAHDHICYRCPDIVVEHATKLIKNNRKRVEKKWDKSGKEGNIFYQQLTNSSDIANYVTTELKKIVDDNKEESVLILSPVQFAVEDIVKKFDDLGIRYTNYFLDSIPQDLIIKSWKLRLLFGDFKYTNLIFLGYKYSQNRSSFYSLMKKQYEKGQNFDELFSLLEKRLPDEIKNVYPDINSALEKEEFLELAKLYTETEGESVSKKLENLFRKLEKIEEHNIKIMSIHKSKGLDADHVFMIGLVEGIIPNKKIGSDSIESQRRRFYVGMTRTKKNLHLLSNVKIEGKHARRVNLNDFQFDRRTRLWNGKASVFIEELKLT